MLGKPGRDVNVLLELINKKTVVLLETGTEKGLCDPSTIACSQELDQLLNEYQRVRKEKEFLNEQK